MESNLSAVFGTNHGPGPFFNFVSAQANAQSHFPKRDFGWVAPRNQKILLFLLSTGRKPGKEAEIQVTQKYGGGGTLGSSRSFGFAPPEAITV